LKPRLVPLLLLVLIIAATAMPATQSAIELRGSWRATAGARTFGGSWTATVDPKTPNSAQGAWTLIEGNRIALQGTWSAEKQRGVWRGSWSARVAPARANASPYSGTWQANVKESGNQTLADMLQRAARSQVDGTWRYGQMSGTWSLTRSAQ
jgi:hypothetical protein